MLLVFFYQYFENRVQLDRGLYSIFLSYPPNSDFWKNSTIFWSTETSFGHITMPGNSVIFFFKSQVVGGGIIYTLYNRRDSKGTLFTSNKQKRITTWGRLVWALSVTIIRDRKFLEVAGRQTSHRVVIVTSEQARSKNNSLFLRRQRRRVWNCKSYLSFSNLNFDDTSLRLIKCTGRLFILSWRYTTVTKHCNYLAGCEQFLFFFGQICRLRTYYHIYYLHLICTLL